MIFKAHLEPGKEFVKQTFFKHKWIFKQSGNDKQEFASVNGLKDNFFEGCYFGAEINSEITVELVGTGMHGLL